MTTLRHWWYKHNGLYNITVIQEMNFAKGCLFLGEYRCVASPLVFVRPVTVLDASNVCFWSSHVYLADGYFFFFEERGMNDTHHLVGGRKKNKNNNNNQKTNGGKINQENNKVSYV